MLQRQTLKEVKDTMNLADVKTCADQDTVDKKLDCLFFALDKNFNNLANVIGTTKLDLGEKVDDLAGNVHMLPSEAALKKETTSIQKLMLDMNMRIDLLERNVARLQGDLASTARAIPRLESTVEASIASTRDSILATMKEKNDEIRQEMNARFDDFEKRVSTKEDLNQFITKDDARAFATKEDLKAFATKEDLKAFATKEDLKAFATKEDLKAFATKEDLKAFATKEDLKAFATKEDLAEIKAMLQDMARKD